MAGKDRQITVRIEEELLGAIGQRAKVNGRTTAGEIRMAMRYWLGNPERAWGDAPMRLSEQDRELLGPDAFDEVSPGLYQPFKHETCPGATRGPSQGETDADHQEAGQA